MSNEFKLPDIGEGLYEAEVVQWLVNEGDIVEADQNIVEVMTDKAVVEISSPVSGEIVKLGAGVNEVIKVGDILAVINEGDKEISSDHEGVNDQDVTNNQDVANYAGEADQDKQKVLASPKVRKLARELHVNISKVTPTGKRGKVTQEDIYRYIEQRNALPSESSPNENRSNKVSQKEVIGGTQTENDRPEKVKISGLRKKIYENMVQSKSKIPHSTGMDEIDVTKLVEFRNTFNEHLTQKELKMTYLPFIVKAVSTALKENSLLNAMIDEENMEIIYNKDIHIGIATATEDGLLVPVIRNTDQKSIVEIAESIEDLSSRARQRKLKHNELTGSTFTISNTGRSGGFFAVPIINYPEVAILGVHRIQRKPVIRDEEIVIGHVMGISLTFDHRIIDGEPAGMFLSQLREILENPELLLLRTK